MKYRSYYLFIINIDLFIITEKYKFEILPEDHTNFDLSFKLINIGDSGVATSCLTNNAVKNFF